MPPSDHRSSYDANGFCVYRSLIDSHQINRVLADLEQAKQRQRRYYTQSTHTWVKLNNLSPEGFLNESIQTPTKQPSLGPLRASVRSLIASPALSGALAELSDFRYFINWQNMLFDKSVGTVDHADTWYLDTAPKGLMIAAWIALEDIDPESGSFFVVPGSHRIELAENDRTQIKDHYQYAEFIRNYIETHQLRRVSPVLNKGDVLFWHPNTIHGSHSQQNVRKSRKSVTAHYHPVGLGRTGHQESPAAISQILRRMQPTDNPCIFLDNSDPSTYQFYYKSLLKYQLKRLLGHRAKGSILMNRDVAYNRSTR
jgi:phytanoyl-CoA hydroxylase